MIVRLQGLSFHTMKPKLKPVSYSESSNGHIRIEYINDHGFRFCHWLNNEEKLEFDKNSIPKTKWGSEKMSFGASKEPNVTESEGLLRRLKERVIPFKYGVNDPNELKEGQRVLIKGSKNIYTIIRVCAPEIRVRDGLGFTGSIYASIITGVLK